MKAIIASAVVIALALSAVAGVTYSWFSDSEEAEISVSTAVVNYEKPNLTGSSVVGRGTLSANSDTITITDLAASQKYSINVGIVNKSSIETVYRVYATWENGDFTNDDLENIYINHEPLTSEQIFVKDWTRLSVSDESDSFTFNISTLSSYGNNQSSESEKTGLVIKITVEAYQGTYLSPAKVGNKEYNDIIDAINAAKNNDTVTLLSDVSKPLTIDKEITLDLNGKKIIVSDPKGVAIKVTSDGKLTITGDGFVDGGSGGDNQAVHACKDSTVIINGGTFTVGADASGFGNSVIESSGGNITVNGGYFYTDYNYHGFYYVLNQNNGSPGTITVNGGTFVDYDPSKGDDNLKGNFVADGYSVNSEVKDNHTLYTVTKNQ